MPMRQPCGRRLKEEETIKMQTQHEKYLYNRYLKLGQKLARGKITPEGFAKKQTKAHLELEERVDHDGLVTSFLNHHGFLKLLARFIKISERIPDFSGSLLAFDVDNLKKFNDKFGHLAGDKLLKTYAGVIERETRQADLRGRAGGDEFMVFLVGTDEAGANLVAERIRIGIVDEVKRVFPKVSWQQTVSCGISQLRQKDTPEKLRQRADEALYKAKKEKDKVVVG